MKKLWWIVLVLIVLAGCATTEERPLPPLPPEIQQLWEIYGEPQIYPGAAMTMVWNMGDVQLHVHLSYDPFVGWVVTGYQVAGTATVPSYWQLLMYVAAKERAKQEAVTDPWGNPITDQRVLNPAVR